MAEQLPKSPLLQTTLTRWSTEVGGQPVSAAEVETAIRLSNPTPAVDIVLVDQEFDPEIAQSVVESHIAQTARWILLASLPARAFARCPQNRATGPTRQTGRSNAIGADAPAHSAGRGQSGQSKTGADDSVNIYQDGTIFLTLYPAPPNSGQSHPLCCSGPAPAAGSRRSAPPPYAR